MSVVVRLLLTSFYYSISSTLFLFFHFACPHLFYEKRIIVLNKFIKNTVQVLKLFLWSYNTEPSDKNANYKLLLRNGQGKNSLLTKHHLYCLDLISGKLYFREAMVSLLPFYFFNFYRGETLITVYRCMTFCGILEL